LKEKSLFGKIQKPLLFFLCFFYPFSTLHYYNSFFPLRKEGICYIFENEKRRKYHFFVNEANEPTKKGKDSVGEKTKDSSQCKKIQKESEEASQNRKIPYFSIGKGEGENEKDEGAG
jgi:hypothetical protein